MKPPGFNALSALWVCDVRDKTSSWALGTVAGSSWAPHTPLQGWMKGIWAVAPAKGINPVGRAWGRSRLSPHTPLSLSPISSLSTAQEGAEFPFLCTKESICDNKISSFRRDSHLSSLSFPIPRFSLWERVQAIDSVGHMLDSEHPQSPMHFVTPN